MRHIGLLMLRLTAGLTLAAHGYPKLFGGPGKPPPRRLAAALGPNYSAAVERSGPAAFAAALERMGVPEPKLAAYLSGLAEFGGGLALASGFATRLAALAAALNMGVAVSKAHWKNGFYGQGGFEFPLLLGVSALTVGLVGPGKISLDYRRSATKSSARRSGRHR